MLRVSCFAAAMLLAPSVARADELDLTGWVGATITVSSQLDAAHGADQFDATPWCAKDGDGVGEAMTITFPAPTHLATLTIGSGNGAEGWNRVTSFEVSTDGGAAVAVTPDPASNRAFVEVGRSVTTVRIAFAHVTAGAKLHASCIHDLGIFTDGGTDGHGGNDHVLLGADPRAVAALATDGASIWTALGHCDDAAAIKSAVRFPIRIHREVDGRDRVTTRRTARSFLAGKCMPDPFEREPDTGAEHPVCARAGVDEVRCEQDYAGGGDDIDAHTRWALLRWEHDRWRLIEAGSEAHATGD